MQNNRDIKKLLGLRIAKLRKTKGLSQEKFAEKVNISPRAMSCIETGVNYPSPSTLGIIIEVLGLTPKDLFDFDEEYNKKELYTSILSKVKFIKDDVDKLKTLHEILEKMF